MKTEITEYKENINIKLLPLSIDSLFWEITEKDEKKEKNLNSTVYNTTQLRVNATYKPISKIISLVNDKE